ncbi:MFS transporter [Zavarzinella formosa]|uniref:MFS transporter n=1 Tax=Zavarzinella formosa TaxID=360055 RepID=UPI00037D38D8|nr:MFS transporter [Zavarzinella formosa]
MTLSPNSSESSKSRWVALTAALLGWMFDGLEMGLFPLVARPALGDLLGTNDGATIGTWYAVITAVFLIGAATGGVVFGWLGDRIGRVRAMTLSVLTYALFSGMCGLAGEAWHVAVMRFVAALGMGGEWSLGVALVMEVWPDQSRAWLAGVIGSAANFGYMIIAVVGLGLNAVIADLGGMLQSAGVGSETSAWLLKNSGWRILMLVGTFPAVLTFLIRLFVPESEKWEQENEKGTTSNWRTKDLLGVVVGAVAAIGLIAIWSKAGLDMAVRIGGSLILFFVVLTGYLYPILRFIERTAGTSTAAERRQTLSRLLIAAALSGVALLGTWGAMQPVPTWADQLTNGQQPDVKLYTQMCTAGGATVGCVIAALVGGWIGRRITYMLMCAASLLVVWNLFKWTDGVNAYFYFSSFICGAVTAAFYGWLPLYLPELFRTKIRATGQGFGFNFGRVLAAIGVLQLGTIMKEFNVGWPVACTSLSAIYFVGMVLIWFAPETKGTPLPD